MLIWLRRAVERLVAKGGEGQREAEYLGYEAFSLLPASRPADVSREGRSPAARKPKTDRKAA